MIRALRMMNVGATFLQSQSEKSFSSPLSSLHKHVLTIDRLVLICSSHGDWFIGPRQYLTFVLGVDIENDVLAVWLILVWQVGGSTEGFH